MKRFRFSFYFIGILSFLLTVNAQAQDYFQLQSEQSKLIIEGTSSIHDWEIQAADFNAKTLLKLDGNVVSEIRNIEFSSPVKGLKSGKGIMDNKTHDALKKKKFPQITFILDEKGKVDLSGEKKANMTGLLTIAGQTRKVSMTVDFKIDDTQHFQVSGKVPLKMSDFGIDPPTAMMGALKTGDNVVVKFDLEFQKSDQELSRNY